MFPDRSSAERRDLFLGGAVQHESFASRRNAIDEPAAVGAGNQIVLRIEGQNADVGLIALEEDRMLALRRNPINLPVVAGSHVEIAGLVQGQVPDIFRTRLEVDGRTPRGIGSRLGRVFVFVFSAFARSRVLGRVGFCRLPLAARRVFELVYLAIGSGGGVDRASGTSPKRLHLKFLGLKNDRCLAVGRKAVHPGGRARRHIDVACIVGCNRPDVSGRRGIQTLERGRQLQAARAANRHAGSRALG